MTGPLGIGVIGVGAVGAMHARLLASGIPGARLVAVADVRRSAAEACAAELGLGAAHENDDKLLADPKVQAVVVATPAETHAAVVEAAAAAGKHVLTEKPLDVDLAAIDRALAAIKKAAVVLQVGFNRRFDANFRAVREAVASGRAGEPVSLHLVSRDPLLPAPPRQIGPLSGLFFDTTVHDFDLATWLLGQQIEEVYVAASSKVHRQASIDSAVIFGRMAGGVPLTIDNSQAVYGYDQRVEVFATKAAIATQNVTETTVSVADAEGVHSPLPVGFYAERYAASYVAQFRAFVDAVVSGGPVPATGEDGRRATVAALAAQRSLDESRPVRLSEIT